MKISPFGYVRCPSCLSHVKATADSVECPFCENSFSCAESHPVIGGKSDSILSKSRAGLIALGLVGMSMAVACSDEDDKKPNNETNNQTNNDTNWDHLGNDYGGFEIDEDWNIEPGLDMGDDVGEDIGEDAEEDIGADAEEDAGDDG